MYKYGRLVLLVQQLCNIQKLRRHLSDGEYPLSKINSRQRQNSLQKALVVHLDPTIAVSVLRSERLGYLLHDDARTHEAVERDSRRSSLITTRGWGRAFHV
jgi:hypothetical protein